MTINPKVAYTLGSLAFASLVGYVAYETGKEVGAMKTEQDFLERMAQHEQEALEEDASKEELPEDPQQEVSEEPAKPDYKAIDARVRQRVIERQMAEDPKLSEEDAWQYQLDEQVSPNEQAKRDFLKEHPYEGSDPRRNEKTDEELTMEADQIYMRNATRYIENDNVINLLYSLENYYVEVGPAIDQITYENSVDERNQIREAKGLAPLTKPTWFDLYIYFLRDFQDDPEELNKHAEDLLWAWTDYMNNYDYITPEELIHNFENNIVAAGNHYSPFSLTQSQINFLESKYRNNLSGQKNEWISPASPLI